MASVSGVMAMRSDQAERFTGCEAERHGVACMPGWTVLQQPHRAAGWAAVLLDGQRWIPEFVISPCKLPPELSPTGLPEQTELSTERSLSTNARGRWQNGPVAEGDRDDWWWEDDEPLEEEPFEWPEEEDDTEEWGHGELDPYEEDDTDAGWDDLDDPWEAWEHAVGDRFDWEEERIERYEADPQQWEEDWA